jgi:diguanylate cyclase (GGDEF)-like protein/PAS domain S-box-containing protein
MFPFRLDRSLRPLLVAAVVFLLAGVAVTVMIRHGEQHNRQEERARVSNLAGDHAVALQRNIERALSATYALAALVRQGNGAISNFDAVASQMLPLYPGASSLQLAPRGVVQSIVPLAGNEQAIGYDLLKDATRTKAAFFARDTGKLTLDGPFVLRQGGMGAVGRLPVFVDDAKGSPVFWGFAGVVIRVRESLEAAYLIGLAEQGFAYQLWRINPDTGQRQVIAASSSTVLIEPVQKTIEVPNATWTLSVAPVKGWGDPLELWLNAALGLLFCLLLAYVAKLLVQSRAHERGLEALVKLRTAEVEAREADLNRAQSVARVGSWVLDFTRKEFRASTEALRIIGISASAPLNFEDFLQRVHPDDRSTVDRAWQAVWKGEPYDIEFRIMTGNAIGWVHSYAELTPEADGTERRALGTVQDITEHKRHEEGLQNFRMAMDASADAIYLVDRASMRFVDVNEAACRMQSRTRAELLALGPDRVLSLPQAELARTYDSIIAGGPGTEPLEMPRQREDGTHVWVELRRRAQRSGAGWMIVTTVRDITERKQAEQALRESAQQLRLFADNVPAMTVSFDKNLRCLFVNKRYVEFFGHGKTDLIGMHLREIVGAEAYREIEGYFVQVLQGRPVTYQRTRKIPNGESGYLEVRLLPHIGEQGKILGCFAVTTDITEHKLTEERIQQVAHHDSLTGLPNRLLFNDRLQQAISLARREARQFALLYLDLDRFKPVNDSLGHAAGDGLLQAVAKRILRQVRESDTVARVGGDEFTVILPDIVRREEAEIVAKKIIAAIVVPFQVGSQKQSVEIGTSIGIAIYPANGQDANALVKVADAAMYSAKQEGNSFRFCAA